MKILVTGGSRGIGAALVQVLARAGCDLVFTFHKNEAKAREIEKLTGAKPFHYDQNSDPSIRQLAQSIQKNSFDVLVNNACQPYKRQTFLNTEADEFIDYLHNGLKGTILLSQAFAAAAKEKKSGGAIVHLVSSVVFGLPPEKQSSYVVLKHAVWGMAKIQAAEFARYNIRVNAVSPSMTRTDFISDLPERFIQLFEENLPMQRIATPEEVASVIAFLVSPQASYVSGANMPITGGLVY